MSGKTCLAQVSPLGLGVCLSGRDTLAMLEVLNSILSKVHTSHPFSYSDLTHFPPNKSEL